MCIWRSVRATGENESLVEGGRRQPGRCGVSCTFGDGCVLVCSGHSKATSSLRQQVDVARARTQHNTEHTPTHINL